MAVTDIKVGRLRNLGFAKEATPGAATFPPTIFPRFLPSLTFTPNIPLLKSPAISGVPEVPTKQVRGASDTVGKLSVELEPSGTAATALGNLWMACLGFNAAPVANGFGSFTHTFSRKVGEIPPTYSWYVDKGNLVEGLTGMAVDRWSLHLVAKNLIKLETDWKGLDYTQAPTAPGSFAYGTHSPLSFSQTQVKVGGVLVNNWKDIVITGNNGLTVDHTLESTTTYGTREWWKHFELKVTGTMFFEDTVEYNKWALAAAAGAPSTSTQSSMEVIITSGEQSDANPTFFSYDLVMPTLNWEKAVIDVPDGPIMVKFEASVLPTPGSPELGRSMLLTMVDNANVTY